MERALTKLGAQPRRAEILHKTRSGTQNQNKTQQHITARRRRRTLSRLLSFIIFVLKVATESWDGTHQSWRWPTTATADDESKLKLAGRLGLPTVAGNNINFNSALFAMC